MTDARGDKKRIRQSSLIVFVCCAVLNASDCCAEILLRLDETNGVIANDASGNGNLGVLVDGPTWNPDGQVNGALTLTADASDRVLLPNTVLDGAQDVTFATWFRTTNGNNLRALISGANSANFNEFLVAIDNGNTVRVYDGEGSGSFESWVLGESLADGQWRHIAVVRDDTNDELTLYIDGVSQGTRPRVMGPLQIDPGGLILGEEQDVVGGLFNISQSFDGSLDEVYLVREALTPDSISALLGSIGYWPLDEGSGTIAADASGDGNDATLVGSPTWTPDGQINGALTLAADASDHVLIPGTVLDGAQDVTFATWFRTTNGNNLRALISGANSANFNEFLVAIDNGNTVRVYDGEGSGSFESWVLGESLADGQWRHIAVVRDDTNDQITLYIDGVSQGMRPRVMGSLQIAPGGLILGEDQDTVGGNFNASQSFDGSIDEVYLFREALTPGEIADLYGLIGHWHFDEGSGTTIADLSLKDNDASFSTGTPTWTDGIYGGALEFDGTNDAATDAVFDPPSVGTVAFWMRGSGPVTAPERVFGVGGDWEARIDSGGIMRFDIGVSPFAGDEPFATTTTVDSVDRWYHIVAMFDDTDNSYAVYVNGELEASGISPRNMSPQPSGLLSFGTRTGSLENWRGALDDFRIYNRWLTVGEVKGLYGQLAYWKFEETSGTVAVDSTERGNDGTYTNSPTLGLNGAFVPETGMSVDFDGSTQFVSTPNSIVSDLPAFSMLGWVRADSLSNDQAFFGQNNAIELGFTDSSGRLQIWTAGGGSVQVDNQIPVGNWTHVAVTGNGTELVVYLDGLEVATGGISTASYGSSFEPFNIGAEVISSSGDNFNGRFDEVQVFNRALTPEELFGIYRGGRPAGIRIRRWVEVR